MRRAKQLGVDLGVLADPFSEACSQEEEDALAEAKVAIRKALWYSILRWANMEEIREPDGMKAPRHLQLIGDEPHHYWTLHPKGKVPIHEVMRDSYLRERASKTFRSADLAAFNAYHSLWESSCRSLEDPAHVEADQITE